MVRWPSPTMKSAWLDRMPLATGVIRRGSFIYANDALVALAGMPREALIGEPFLHRVAPEDRDRMGDRHERRLRGEPVPGSYEFTFLRHDGSRRRMEIWVSTDADGDVIFQLHDRTDRALRHDKLAALAKLGAAVQVERDEARIFEALGRGLVDLGAAIVRLAPSSAEMRVIEARAPGDQVARFEAKIGRRAVDLVGVWGPGAATAWREGSAYLDDLPLGVGRFLTGDPVALEGARASLFPRAVMLRVDREGRAHQLLVVMASWLLPEDLPACRLFAAQVSAAIDLTRAQQKLVERERLAAIGELSAVVAHEVRNPLGVLFNSIGAIRKLLGKGVDPSVDTLLAIMDEESTRLNHIVGDLLDFARPKTPSLTRERLDHVVLEAIDVPRADVFVVRAIADVPPVPLDPRLMRQALQNLIDNAVQAMPSGGTLTVRVGLDEGGAARRARVDIEDTGSGIAPDVEDRIFEPFFTTRASGTGLGLAVVKRIIEGHRGQLEVKSAEGRGTTFTLWLPVDEERASEPEIEPPSRV